MSQLDISISFYNIIGLILCFYIFFHLVLIILIKYLYNKKILSNINLKILKNNLLKRILKV